MVFYYPFWMLQFFQRKFLDCESITHIIWHVKKNANDKCHLYD